MNVKPGDIVKIVDHRGQHWNDRGEMDCWMKKVVTIDKTESAWIGIKDDGGYWDWKECDFVPATEEEILEYSKHPVVLKLWDLVALNDIGVVTITMPCPQRNAYYIEEDGQSQAWPIESFTYPDNLQLSEYVRRNKKKDSLEAEEDDDDWLDELEDL